MTQNSLIEIGYGSEASSSVLNGNFEYLDDKIGTEVARITGGSETTIASLSSNIDTINNTISNGAVTPAGTIIMWGGAASTPTGYLFCDGGSYNKNTYQSLFNAIGYTYGGSGDNFNVPQISDARYPIGWTASGGYADNQYETVGCAGFDFWTSGVGDHTHLCGQGYPAQSGGAGSHSHDVLGWLNQTRMTQPKYITLRFCIKY